MIGALVTAGLALGLGSAAADRLDVAALPSALAATSPLTAVAAEGDLALAVGPRGHVLRSDDGGLRWTQASVPASADLTAVHVGRDGRALAVGHDGLVLASEDRGRSWRRRLDGRDVAALLRAGHPGCDGGRDGAAALRIACEQGAALSLLDVWVGEDGRGLAVGGFGLALWTEDGGRTWAPWLDRTDNPRALHLYAVRGVGGEVLVVGEQGLVLRLDRARRRLVRLPAPAGGSLFGLAVRGREVVAFGLGGRALRSADAGATWSALHTGLQGALVGGALLPDGALVLATARGALVASADGDRTLRPLAGAAGGGLAAVAAAGRRVILVTGAAGVRRLSVP